jgi:hypothetical protein
MIKKVLCLVVLVGAFYAVKAQDGLTEEEENAARDALYGHGEFQGDVKLSKEQRVGLKNRVAINNLSQRWPNGTIPFYVDPSLANLRPMILKAAEHIKQHTGGCIKFVERGSATGKVVRMYFGQGCWSYMGVVNSGVQDLSLGSGCEYFGTVVHEMLHAVGFDHEQNRPDRDQYLTVYLNNVDPSQRNNFNPTPGGRTFTSFDYNSIMIYGEYSFSMNRQKTMVAKNGTPLTDPFAKPQGMSPSDDYQVKAFYQGVC